ncbi:hypothetical protein GCM10023347_25690 [Streptomyces chumphonensis]|uniref:Secreted protein n=1 Tax=Streptomyces chumphonensis TaxID=1214925 RepID=A0A927IB03_9ACTN|nr:hypothetical protein [Streptomyces chumphonensis]MBD3932383.1 hypothetical protein [Streptomyces chumphonensis]
MRISPQGRFAALSMCAAATLAPAAEAVADGRDVPVPVDVPLESVEETLPLEAPTVFATVPSSPITPPETPQIMRGDRISVPVVPSLGAVLDTPGVFAEAPVPGLDGTAAQLSTSSETMDAAAPSLTVDLPLTNPGAEPSGLPRLTAPDARLTTPTLHGERTALVDVVSADGQSRLPDALGQVTGLL